MIIRVLCEKGARIMKTLTPIRAKILEFVNQFVDDNGFPPTVREICDAVNLRSPSTVYFHLNVLKDEGYLDKDGGKMRSISVKNKPAYKAVPIVGTVTAGKPILAQEEICGYVPFENADGVKLFALKVRGDSMINAGILDGDIVIVRQQSDARHGQIVVAMIEDEATVKRLNTKNGVWLMPENDAYEPIDGTYCTILGLVVSLYRDNVI